MQESADPLRTPTLVRRQGGQIQLLALISALATIFAGSWVAIRLLALARRTGEAPERVIGIGMLAFGGLAYPLFLVGVLAAGRMPRGAEIAVLVGAHLGYWTCLFTLALFTRIVFRPTATWSILVVAGVTLLETAGAGLSIWHTLGSTVRPSYEDSVVRISGAMISTSFTLLFLWTSVEAIRYRSALKKRLALGLADPVVVNRMGVWAVGTGVACVIDGMIAVCNGIGLNPAQSAVPALLQSASGLACSLTWLLTFAPPAAYREWVRRRADATEAGA